MIISLKDYKGRTVLFELDSFVGAHPAADSDQEHKGCTMIHLKHTLCWIKEDCDWLVGEMLLQKLTREINRRNTTEPDI